MSNVRRPLLALLALGLPTACADPCIDDGLGQASMASCPTLLSASATEGATESNGNTESNSNSNSNSNTVSDSLDSTASMSGSQSGSGTETDGGTLWCVDADGDGFGDPEMCTQSDEQPPGTVDNDDDCDDCNPNTFPGAAPNDDPEACMQDDDGDGWGDDDPPPGVEPGTDCDDDDPNTHPGAAENEIPPDQCMTDADGDGWGDANPPGGGGGGGGPVGGSDCYDGNPQLNPDTLQLTVFQPYNTGAFATRSIQTIDPNDASFAQFVQLGTPGGGIPNVNIVSATFNEQAEIFANDLTSVRLQSVDYAKTCSEGLGVIAPVSMMAYGPGGDIVCGLEFGADGTLYGIGHTGDDLRTFDPSTGEVLDAIPITYDGGLLDVFSCGMARDCTESRLLLANGVDRAIYGIDPATAEAELIRDLSAFFPSTWTPTGLEYDPVSRTALLSTGDELYRIDLDDDTVDPELIGIFEDEVSNLQYLPICL